MITSEDMPKPIVDWIAEHAETVGDDLAAVNMVIVMYEGMDSDGDAYWNYRIMGEMGAMRVTGLLELVKLRLLTPHIRAGLEEASDE